MTLVSFLGNPEKWLLACKPRLEARGPCCFAWIIKAAMAPSAALGPKSKNCMPTSTVFSSGNLESRTFNRRHKATASRDGGQVPINADLVHMESGGIGQSKFSISGQTRSYRLIRQRETQKTHQQNNKIFFSHGHLRIVATHRTSPVDPFKQHRSLCCCECDGSTRRLRTTNISGKEKPRLLSGRASWQRTNSLRTQKEAEI